MKMLKEQDGFTLVEILVAITIFAVGLLALAQMQLVSMKGNGSARVATEASSLVQSKFEELKLLPLTDPDLADNDATGTAGFGIGGLNETGVAADHSEDVTSITGRNYTLFWNVVENTDDTRLVRVIVAWNERSLTQKNYRCDMLLGEIGL